MTETVEERCRKRAEIRRSIPNRKSVEEGAPDRIADLLDEAAAEIERLKTKADKQAMIIRHLCPSKSPEPVFFISGASYDATDCNGLPAHIFICPAYGCDWSILYERTEKGVHPEW